MYFNGKNVIKDIITIIKKNFKISLHFIHLNADLDAATPIKVKPDPDPKLCVKQVQLM
jgi:hypothetical protein